MGSRGLTLRICNMAGDALKQINQPAAITGSHNVNNISEI